MSTGGKESLRQWRKKYQDLKKEKSDLEDQLLVIQMKIDALRFPLSEALEQVRSLTQQKEKG